jgi:hypothetical protein
MKWMVQRMFAGYMAQGEGVSNVSKTPIPSTSPEPVTAAWFMYALLAYEGKADMRLVAPQHNAGAAKKIDLQPTANSADQWRSVPYYADPLGDRQVDGLDIASVYAANDASNLYVRLNFKRNGLPVTPVAQVSVAVYSDDFKKKTAAVGLKGLNGETLDRPMAFALELSADNSRQSMYSFANGKWNLGGMSAAKPYVKWSEQLELSLPLGVLSSGAAANGDWSNLNVVVYWTDPTTNTRQTADLAALNYRVTADNQLWLYGNVE